jgi:hypothetical protein
MQSVKRSFADAAALTGGLLLAGALAVLALGACTQEGSVKFESGGMTNTIAEGKESVPKDFIPLVRFPQKAWDKKNRSFSRCRATIRWTR